jgi:hypothetical protein
MLQARDDQALQLVKGAAYTYRKYIKDYKSKPRVTLPLAAFSSDHGQPEERFANLLCMAYGSDPKEFAQVVDDEFLPSSRAKNCHYDYQDNQFAFETLIGPHIDKEAAKKVLNTRWISADKPSPAH